MSLTRFWTMWVEGAGRMSRETSLLVGAGLLLVAGVLDWETGPEIASAIFYLVPILWVTWKAGLWLGLGTAVASGATWLLIVLLSEKKYSNEFIPFWNTFVRTVSFCLVSALAAEVLARRRVERRLRRANENLEKQTDILVCISDREQRRLGEDLHDGLCQHLVSTAFAARKLAARLSDRELPEAEDATEIADLLGESISQARDVARGLYLVSLEADGLASALEGLALRTRGRHHVLCQFSEGDAIRGLEEAVGSSLFRIAQEAVNNAIKHAKAKSIAVVLSADAQHLKLTVEDDGVGIRPDFATVRGLGLHMMSYRARMIGAALTVEPRAGGGTLVTCSLRGSNFLEANAEAHVQQA